MHEVYLSLGSNLGDRIAFLTRAREQIARNIGHLKAISALYQTAPWGSADQPDFINQVICVSTRLSPQKVLALIREIEDALGRERNVPWGPRTLDIDILLYNNLDLNSETLKIPHPQMPYRRFVLVPLCEIAPDLIHPVYGITIEDLLKQTPDHSEVSILPHR